MKFNYIELKGYRRVALNSIDYIRITFENLIVLLLGTNGSGKSSLLAQLTPLPAAPSDFVKDGYKIVELVHNGSTYLLKNIFASTGNKYHFIKDGEEANPGGVTISVFRELVKQEFGITPDIHALMIGQTKFHSLSVAERRNWLTKISDTDFTYALSYFSKLKDRLRDTQGAIKLAQSRLVQESDKLVKPEREEELKKEIEILRDILSKLLDIKKPLTTTVNEALQVISDGDITLNVKAKRLVQMRSDFLNLEGYQSIEEIDHDIIDSQSWIQTYTSSIQALFDSIDSKQKTLDTLKSSNLESFKDIDTQIDHLTSSIAKEESLIQTKHRPNPEICISVIDAIQNDISDLIASLTEYQRHGFTRDSYRTLTARQEQYSNLIKTLENNIQVFGNKKRELDHHKEHGSTECPKCQHVWIRGFSEAIYKETLLNIENFSNQLVTVTQQKAKIDAEQADCTAYFQIIQSIAQLTKASPALRELWDEISIEETVFKQPKAVLTALMDYRQDMSRLMSVIRLKSELGKVFELKKLTVENQELSLKSLEDDIESLNKELFSQNELLSQYKKRHSKLNLYRKTALLTIDGNKELEELLVIRQKQTQEVIESVRTEYINECIHLTKIELNTREQQLSKVDIQKALVGNIQKQISEYQEQEELLKIAVKELSPSEGLIAKGMTGFINHFVKKMNSFIKKIWLYPLELVPIVPSQDEGIDLDYKFSVKINDDIEISDVSLGSSAMKEVIDLAFKIVSMPYLGLSEAPLYLDELGASFDKKHRSAVKTLIDTLVISANYSQVFIVSHYEEMYGSFKNCDINVLCPANVRIPNDSGYNKNCVIE